MATPTEAEVRTQIDNAVLLLDDLYGYYGTATTGLQANYDSHVAALEGDWSADALAGAEALRASASAVLRQGRRLLDPLWLTYGKVLDFPDRTPEGVIRRLFVEFAERGTPQQIQERNFTFGTPSADGSNAGDGALHRLNVDRYSYEIENQFADAKTARCVQDAHSGALQHEEVFEFRGGNAAKDLLVVEGSGQTAQIKAASARDSQAFIKNPSFSQFAGTTGTPTEITGWTVTSSIGNFQLDQTNTYRSYRGEGTATSLRFDANDTVTQAFTVKDARFNPFVPYHVQIAWNRSIGSGDGTITLTFGNVSDNVVLSAQSGWQVLQITTGANCWHRQFNKEGPTIAISLGSNTTGYVLVDDVIITPYTAFDNSWYALVGGATPWLRDDFWTWTDSISSDAKIQFWIWFLYDLYLPADATPTWSDP